VLKHRHDTQLASRRCKESCTQNPTVKTFFHPSSNTFSYVVSDPATRKAAVFDSVLDCEAASERSRRTSADELIAWVRAERLTVDWVIDTHVHADHLSAAPHVRTPLGGKLAIGEHVRAVQDTFGKLFNEGSEFRHDGSQFDHLFSDGERYMIGDLKAFAVHTSGHTPACMTHVVGDAAFVGDTLSKLPTSPRWQQRDFAASSTTAPTANRLTSRAAPCWRQRQKNPAWITAIYR
jgi:glyoxylase-like metal-dependent hydrolase (beta-lactamase superfamily II)